MKHLKVQGERRTGCVKADLQVFHASGHIKPFRVLYSPKRQSFVSHRGPIYSSHSDTLSGRTTNRRVLQTDNPNTAKNAKTSTIMHRSCSLQRSRTFIGATTAQRKSVLKHTALRFQSDSRCVISATRSNPSTPLSNLLYGRPCLSMRNFSKFQQTSLV